MSVMARKILVLFLALLLLSASFASASALATSSPARIVNGFLSNAILRLVKWVKSLRATTKTGIARSLLPVLCREPRPGFDTITGRPMMKFESGYNVETVFDGSKLGIEPHTVEILPSGDLLILDSANSNLYRISSSLSLYSRPKLVAGSAEGNPGHVDGKLKEARFNHPKGLTIDDRGNIYIADADNMAIRKISDAGITTIAGGKKGRGGGHVDGPSDDAKFSNDFDVVYVGSSCSLLVIDRGNQAIREIQLHFDDCAYQYGSGFPLGIVVLVAAGFFGYMLALLQRRVGTIVSSQDDQRMMMKASSLDSYQKPIKTSVRPPLIPSEGEEERQEESFFGSLGKLLSQTGASAAEILGGLFPWFQKKSWTSSHYQQQEPLIQQQNKYNSNTWPVQDSYVIRDEDDPPSIEARTPTPRKTYPFMSKDSEKMQQFRQGRAFYSGWDGNFQQQQPSQQMQTQKQQHRHQYHSSSPQTYYEQTSERTNEIVFGAVQQDGEREAVVIKPLDHGTNIPYDRHRTIRSRMNSIGSYSNGHH